MLPMPLPQPEPPQSGERPLAAGETSRSIALGDRPVSYVLRRSRRHTIGLSIDQQGLRVGAPERVSLREIESLIRQHGKWVGRKLDEWQNRRPPERLQIVDGAQLPLLGRPLGIRLAVGANRIGHRLQHHQRKARSVFGTSTIVIGPAIAGRIQKLVDQVTARAMQFHSIHASRDCILGGRSEFTRQRRKLISVQSGRQSALYRHAIWPRNLVWAGFGRRSDDSGNIAAVGGNHDPPAVHDLHDDFATFRMDSVRHCAPSINLLFRPDTRCSPITFTLG